MPCQHHFQQVNSTLIRAASLSQPGEQLGRGRASSEQCQVISRGPCRLGVTPMRRAYVLQSRCQASLPFLELDRGEHSRAYVPWRLPKGSLGFGEEKIWVFTASKDQTRAELLKARPEVHHDRAAFTQSSCQDNLVAAGAADTFPSIHQPHNSTTRTTPRAKREDVCNSATAQLQSLAWHTPSQTAVPAQPQRECSWDTKVPLGAVGSVRLQICAPNQQGSNEAKRSEPWVPGYRTTI